MATLARPPVVQPTLRHPEHMKAGIFQPRNMLCGLVAATLAAPLKNQDALAWSQIQHPSRINGYLNPDTSKSRPKTLLSELTLPIGANRILQAPEPVRLIVNTGKGTFYPLLIVTPPFIPAPHLVPIRPQFNPVNTSAGMPKVLFADTRPTVNYNQTVPGYVYKVMDILQGSPTILTVLIPTVTPPTRLISMFGSRPVRKRGRR